MWILQSITVFNIKKRNNTLLLVLVHSICCHHHHYFSHHHVIFNQLQQNFACALGIPSVTCICSFGAPVLRHVKNGCATQNFWSTLCNLLFSAYIVANKAILCCYLYSFFLLLLFLLILSCNNTDWWPLGLCKFSKHVQLWYISQLSWRVIAGTLRSNTQLTTLLLWLALASDSWDSQSQYFS